MKKIQVVLAMFLLALFAPMPPAAPPTAKETEADRWNLADIYPSQADWQAAKERVEADLDKLSACQGELASSASKLKECLDLLYGLQKEVVRVGSYASMLSDEDTRVDQHAQMRQEATLLRSSLAQKSSFVRPELIAAGKEKIEGFVESESGLAIYRQPLDDILRQAPHTRSAEVEEVMAQVGPLAGAPSNVYRTLANADLPWPTVRLSDGEEVRLNQAAYTRYRAAPNREDRRLVFETFWAAWKTYERTVGVSLYSQLLRDHLYGKVRRYPNSLTSALSSYNIPEEVYRTLVRVTNENLDTLHRYFKIRGRMLGIQDLRYYDIYPPLLETGLEFPLSKAQELTMVSARPLGDEYLAVMKKGFAGRWIDNYPREGKRSGAYMNGSVYDVHPYMLLNYNEDYNSVSTLAHEFGHALHSYLSNTTQPYPTARYSIFVAEVASTANEHLLLDHMLKQAKNDEERLFYLGHELENLRGTFFRQTMFAEFELKVHDLVDAGEALTGSRFTEIYGDLLRRYHGHDKGVLTIDDAFTVEWAYIPHFYYNFYVYQYATSMAAAAQFSDAILSDEAGATERYLRLLKSGSSKYPMDLLKEGGVDLASPEPYLALIRRANRVMDQIEEILDRKG